MRKSFKHILLAGLTIASTAMAMNAQTLTQDWKVTEGLPTAGNARWGIGFDGKVYTNDKSVPQIIAINAEGENHCSNERCRYSNHCRWSWKLHRKRWFS